MAYINRPLDTSATTTMTIKAGGDRINDNFEEISTGDMTITGKKTFDNIAFNTATSTQATKAQFAWNEDEGTLDLGLNGGNVTLQLGQETVYRVTNNSGVPITNGMLVMAVGTVGASGRILVAPYDGTSPSKRIMGLATENIPNGQDGYVTHFGKVRGINTSAYQEGDILWASPSGNGALTKVKPEAPNTKTIVAIVINSHVNVGTVLVRVSQGSNLDDDELVELGTLNNGETLFFNTTNGRFENRLIQQSDVQGLVGALDGKVDKVTGKQLSTEDYTTAEKNKLAAMATNEQLRDRSTHTGTQPHTTVTGLGTAATANVTTSATDTTVGRLLKVGDFGVGSSARGNFSGDQAIGRNNGFEAYYAVDTTNGVGPVDRSAVFSIDYGSIGGGKIAIDREKRSIYFQVQRGSNLFDGWRELYHTGNILGTVSQSGGVPTGAIIQRGSNANGEFVRYADGTQICTKAALIEYNNSSGTGNFTSTWTYPITFSIKPDVVDVQLGTPGHVDIGRAQSRAQRHLTRTTTTCDIYTVITTALGSAIQADIIAIGRWY